MANKLPGGLYALIDEQLRPELPVLKKARAAIEGGVKVLQLRLKASAERPAVAVIRAVLALARASEVVVIVNDRVDWALVTGADGVHLGDADLPPDQARAVLGAKALIGVTARNLEEIRAAQALGADHVGVGPIFTTSTKVVDAPRLGLEAFGRIARASPLPVVGIAGITLATIGAVARAGAHAAAVGGDLLLADDLVSRAKALQEAFWRS